MLAEAKAEKFSNTTDYNKGKRTDRVRNYEDVFEMINEHKKLRGFMTFNEVKSELLRFKHQYEIIGMWTDRDPFLYRNKFVPSPDIFLQHYNRSNHLRSGTFKLIQLPQVWKILRRILNAHYNSINITPQTKQ